MDLQKLHEGQDSKPPEAVSPEEFAARLRKETGCGMLDAISIARKTNNFAKAIEMLAAKMRHCI